MTETVQIRRFASTYRLRSSQLEARARLDRLVPQLLGEPLELALERAGIGSRELVCIRRIRVPVRLRLSRSDSELLAAWALDLAQAVVGGAAEGLRYSSRPLALVEMGTHLSERRFHNAWAWRQLGFWRLPALDTPSPSVAAAEFAATLEREPELALAVLIALARNGSLRPVLQHMGSGLVNVAVAVLALAGHSAGVIEEVLLNSESRVDAAGASPASRTGTRAWQVVTRSSILASAAGIAMQGPSKTALYLIASLECEPSLALATPSAITQSIGAVHLLNLPGADTTLPAPQRAKPVVSPGPAGPSDELQAAFLPFSKPAAELQSDAPRAASSSDFVPNDAPATIRSSPSDSPDNIEPAPTTSTSTVSSASDSPANDAAAAIASSSTVSSADDASALSLTRPDSAPRREPFTRFGGLLFLLRILDQLNIPARMLATPIAAERGLRWMLHQLALILQPLPPDDAAALAFCGLTPEARPPSEEVPPPSPEEHLLLNSFADEIRASLAEIFAEASGESHLPERTLQFVCRRYARVIADPGWIEFRFALQDVSTPIRAAGLDLDPNYVPWLGMVIRFVYE